ncbi:MAG TPA: PEP-CTERM sorting domain-containing protein [Roseiarcus sp.]|jgi:hypothetical protein
MKMRVNIVLHIAVCSVAMALGAAEAQANGLTPGGTIIGVFSNVVTNGSVTHDPTLSSPPVYFDNAGTAAFSIVNSTDPTLGGTPPQQSTGSKLQWGVSGSVDPSQSFSELIFFGGQVPTDVTQPFQAGVLTFLNGTSDLDSLIFAADLSLYDNYVGTNSYLGTDHVTITTTSNLNVAGAEDLDADYINICGNGSTICNSSVEAYEDSQGGTGVTFDLTAQIVGDPQLEFTHVALAAVQTNLLDPNSGPGLTGLVGDQAAGTVPEPSTWAMMFIGFVGLGALGYRSKRARAAQAA